MKGQSAPRRIIAGLIGLAVSALFLFLSLRKVDLAELWAQSRAARLEILSWSLVLKGVGFSLMAWRARMLLRVEPRLSASLAVKSVLVGFVGNNVLPLRLGELLRVGYLTRKTASDAEGCVALTAMERSLDLLCMMVVLALAATLVSVDLSLGVGVYMVALAALISIVIAAFLSRHPDQVSHWAARLSAPFGTSISSLVSRSGARLAKGFGAFRSPRGVITAFVVSLGYWATMIGSVQIWIWGFELDLPWYAPIVTTAFIAVGTALPSSPAFVGTYHYFGSASLTLFGVPEHTAAAFGVVGHALAVIPYTLIALPFLGREVFGSLLRPTTAPKSDPVGADTT